MNPIEEPHEWDAQALLNKAQSYSEVMLSFPRDDWKFAVWSTFSLELLARAALSTYSPTLVAETRNNWDSLLYSLGIQPNTKNFVPRAVDISEVFRRLQELIRDFTPELQTFCARHMSKRNEELHSGGTPFVGVSTSSWLPTYYESCVVLLSSMGESLEKYLGNSEAGVAEAIMTAAKDESAEAIKGTVHAHSVAWDNNSTEEKELLGLQSSTWATRQTGHRVTCPACKCTAILAGSAIAPPLKAITEDDEITETQEYLPAKFECVGCGLKISGLSQLNAAGLGDTFNATFTYDANEYYASADDYGAYEPDFNEP